MQDEAPVVEPSVESPAVEQQASGGEQQGNPAWNEIRSQLDPTTFKLIEPSLKGWEASAQKRIEDSNKQYGWAAELTKQGVTPEQVQQSLLIANKLNEDPAAIHEALGNFLRENGRLPDKQELQQQVKEDADDEDAPTEDPRLSQLEQQQQQMAQFLQQQQEQAALEQASRELDQEIDAMKSKHPEFGDADVQEVVQRAALKAQVTGQVPSMEDMAAEYIGLRNRILTTPRAADSAPRLLPTGGGVAQAAGSTKTLGQLDKNETQGLVAQLLQNGGA